MGAYKGLYNMMYQAYGQLMNRPQIQPVIYLENREPEVVNTNQFTPEVIDQVNRATALIDEVKNNTNPISDETDSEQILNDFIAFAYLLHHNFSNSTFDRFTDNLGFSCLFMTYCAQNENPSLVNFFVRVANRKDLIPGICRKLAILSNDTMK